MYLSNTLTHIIMKIMIKVKTKFSNKHNAQIHIHGRKFNIILLKQLENSV